MPGLSENLESVLTSIRNAEKATNRPEGSVKLIVVSKFQPNEKIAEAIAAGQVDFGENRVQEMAAKQLVFPRVNWHMIGAFQKNKVTYLAHFVTLIHSVDSPELLTEISKHAQKQFRTIPCLLQINISDEEQKSGMDEPDAEHILKHIADYPGVEIYGLMGIAELTEDRGKILAQFHRLRLCFDAFKKWEGPTIKMQELSMGMSGDFDLAITEGATMVRVGTAVFGGR